MSYADDDGDDNTTSNTTFIAGLAPATLVILAAGYE